MEDNGCSVLEASEAPFFMSQLLSKLDPRDNMDFGREMQRENKDESVTNLINLIIDRDLRHRPRLCHRPSFVSLTGVPKPEILGPKIVNEIKTDQTKLVYSAW